MRFLALLNANIKLPLTERVAAEKVYSKKNTQSSVRSTTDRSLKSLLGLLVGQGAGHMELEYREKV